jgi:integrase
MARCVPSPAPEERTSSARLLDEAATPVDEGDAVASVERTTNLDGAELLTEAAFARGADSRADIERFSRVYELATTSTTTRRLYLNRLTLFRAWCAARGVGALPAHPEVLRLYLVSLAAEQKALSTIDVSVAAITMAHRALGHEPPMSDALRITLRSLRRTLGPQRAPSTSISLAMLRQLVAPCEHDPHGIRDRALMLVTFFACLRRADVVGLNREGAQREERGYRLTVGREAPYRTDSPTLVVHTEPSLCPVRALDDWLGLPALWVRGLDHAPTCGPVFVGLHRGRRQRFHVGDRLAPNDLDRIVKRRAVAAGLNPAGLSATSLRPGFSADAALGETSSVA